MFFLRDMVKDLDLALDLFHSAGASMPGLGLTRELYAAAVPEHGLSDAGPPVGARAIGCA